MSKQYQRQRMPFLLAAANKSGIEMALLEKNRSKNVAGTPEARFKQRAHEGNTHRERIRTMLKKSEG